MPEGQTSLQEAMSRIMGMPAGGTPQTPQAQNAASFAPQSAYSGDLTAPAPATNYSITNTPFDPFAGEKAALAAAQTALTAPKPAAVAPAAVAAPAVSSPWGQLSGTQADQYKQYLAAKAQTAASNPTGSTAYR